MSLGPDFTTLNHWYGVDGFQFRSVIYEAPIRPNKAGTKYEPWLADKVEESSDGLSVAPAVEVASVTARGPSPDVSLIAARSAAEEVGNAA